MKRFLVICTVLFVSDFAIAQSDGNYDYTKEFVWGVNKNTRGGLIGGFIFKWSKSRGEKQFSTFGFEMVNLKNPDEVKLSTGFGQFIPLKTNYLYPVRFQFGRGHILFKKTPSKGVQINVDYAGGPSIGVVAPYYVTNDQGESYHFRPGDDYREVISTGYPFEGLFESELTAGFNLKASLSFEMGAFKSNVTGFEVGTLFDYYFREVELMVDSDKNTKFYPTLFITFFYGKRK
ncbi:hypothetical protein [Reichenbachiella versicolor]|uniref:hypothetical protein n=1 Tax=Reichenbachiella versicolor TaxID=1821036 RepID=UPI000D6E359D|nr:hypothetical protein [Reichenbachiella versicolor]